MAKFLRSNIDMRSHLRGLLHGDKHNIAYGHWIIYHELDHDRLSPHWNENLAESVGGDKFEYTDFIIRTRRFRHGLSAGGTSSELQTILEGLLEPEDYIYYIEYKEYNICTDGQNTPRVLNVKVEDSIYEIDKFEGATQPLPPYAVTKKMKVKLVEPILGDYGRIEYWLVVAKESETRF